MPNLAGTASRSTTPPPGMMPVMRGAGIVLGRAVLRRPGRTLAMVAIGGLSALVLVNALTLQPERHHAPFFTGALPPPTTPAAVVPLPPSRQALPPDLAARTRRDAVSGEITAELTRRGFFVPPEGSKPGTTLDAAIRDYQDAAGLPVDGLPSEALLAHVATSKVRISDQILQMLRPGQPDPRRTAIAAQRALNKLGYGPLREDGLAGAGTRAAIERFERDRKLPQRGEPQGRVLKELAAASGLPVE